MEHYIKQKNLFEGNHQKKNSIPTLKIKNITFLRQSPMNINRDIFQISLKLSKDLTQKYQQFRNDRDKGMKYRENNKESKENNKQNKQNINNENNTIFKPIIKPTITDLFSIKAMNLQAQSHRFYQSQFFCETQLRNSTSNDRRILRHSFSRTGQKNKSNKHFSLLKFTSNPMSKVMNRGYSYQNLQFSKQNIQNKNKIHYSIKQYESKTAQGQKKRLLIIKNQKKLQLNQNLNTNLKIFEKKLQSYWKYIQEIAKCHAIKQFNFVEEYSQNPIYVVGRGNNAKLLKQIMKKRWWLKCEDRKINKQTFQNQIQQVNLLWTQSKVPQYYQPSLKPFSSTRIHNHFANNNILGNKKQLFYCMKSFYQSINKNPFQFLPFTFHVQNTTDQSFLEFRRYYESEKVINPSNKCLWIVKPGENSNRGHGITIHTQITQIQKLILEQITNKNQSIQHSFIIQKYIQKPFLYQRRKFDIRHYFLLVNINQSIKGYWYKQGYIRTSCFQFNLNLSNDSNFYVHLTNDAVQKNCSEYGKYQDGNKIDYNTFKKYLALKYNNKKYDFQKMIYEQMKSITLDAIKASYKQIRNKENTKKGKDSHKQIKTFEVFGLDFMIDENFKPWLIEINTNPCLETSCFVLERIIPKMIDEALQLSIDVVYPPPMNWAQSRRHMVPNTTSSGFELIFDETQENLVNNHTQN